MKDEKSGVLMNFSRMSCDFNGSKQHKEIDYCNFGRVKSSPKKSVGKKSAKGELMKRDVKPVGGQPLKGSRVT